MKETTHATYARAYTRPYQKTGTGKLKLNGNMYGTGRSVHRPFNYRSISVRRPCFFKRAPVEQIVRGNFFLTSTVFWYVSELIFSTSPPPPPPHSYLNAIHTSCPHILRYVTAAVITNKRRQSILKDLIRVIKRVSPVSIPVYTSVQFK